jgi:hypothetical protein
MEANRSNGNEISWVACVCSTLSAVTVEVVSEYTDPKEIFRGEVLSFHATVMTEAHFVTRPDYVWRVSGGKILNVQHTPWIKVEASVMSDPLLTLRSKLKDLICRV